jgi:hypothetical protein
MGRLGRLGQRKAAAEILSGLSIKTIERRGVDWRTCSDEALIALRGESERTSKWLETFTGYTAQWAAEMLKRAGLDWKTASLDAIRRALAVAMDRERHRLEIIRDGKSRYTVAEYAAAVGISLSTLRSRRRRLGSWERVVQEIHRRPGLWGTSRKGRKPSPGRPEHRFTIDGETRSLRGWCAELDMTRAGVWKAAKRNKRTTAEELTERVRARRSDAVHAPASTAVAYDQPPRVVRGDRVASACAASERGAVANDSKEAAA